MPTRRLQVEINDRSSAAERWTKLIVPVAIAGIVAFYGHRIGRSVDQRSLEKEYVALAISILSQDQPPGDLREWAARLLAANAPANTRLSEEVVRQLALGEADLPSAMYPMTVATVPPDHYRLLKELKYKLEAHEWEAVVADYFEPEGVRYHAVAGLSPCDIVCVAFNVPEVDLAEAAHFTMSASRYGFSKRGDVISFEAYVGGTVTMKNGATHEISFALYSEGGRLLIRVPRIDPSAAG